MRQILLVLGIASIFFAQNMSAQMDDVGGGEKFPTGDCKVAASNFVRNLTGNNKKKIVYDPEQNIYNQLIDNLNTAVQIHQSKTAGKNSENLKKSFERERRTLEMSCGEHIKWADGSFEKINYGTRTASPTGSGGGSN